MNIFKYIFVSSFIFCQVFAGHRVGNGGDHLRSTFLKMGSTVMDYLTKTDNGKILVQNNNLDLLALEGTLSIEKVIVEEFIPTDNSGSMVDAIGIPGLVTLNAARWLDHFEKNRDIYYLVFHEMLRSAAIDDDNYVLSKALNPFPLDLRIVTRVSTEYPVLGVDQLRNSVDISGITFGGSGCNHQEISTNVDFDLQRNILDLDLQNYRMVVDSAKSIDRKSCAIAIPIRGIPGKRIVISQFDMTSKVDIQGVGKGFISAEVFLAGSRGEVERKEIVNQDGSQTGRLLLRKNEAIKTECGVSQILRVNTGAGLSLPEMNEASSVLEVDRVSVYLKVETCE